MAAPTLPVTQHKSRHTVHSQSTVDSHSIESEVRRQLLSVPGVRVASLVVRRLPNGVCLQGVLRCQDRSIDVCGAIRQIAGVQQILNHMVICSDLSDGDESTASAFDSDSLVGDCSDESASLQHF